MKLINDYELVVGLEIHAELKTRTKIFCSCPTSFGAEPNAQCCPICMGHPGTLPSLNREVPRLAVLAGLAMGCGVNSYSAFDRKNYFYPDLPKGYQITQFYSPICEGGELFIDTDCGKKRIGITRIHIEEDAGKLIHSDGGTLIDCNRCGVPLIEIVTEPDISSPDEAKSFLKRLRTVLLYADVSDCRMNEGSLRCDVNLSVRRRGQTALGVRTEIKNLNSFAFAAKAIESEYERQVAVLEAGGEIVQQTLRFDSQSGRVYSMRKKENADDYRFFPDPDLPPLILNEDFISELKETLPEMPDARVKKYAKEYGISGNIAEILVSDRALADYFEEAAAFTEERAALANLIATELLRLADRGANVEFSTGVRARSLASVATLLGGGVINASVAKKLLCELDSEDFDPALAVEERSLAQIRDRDRLEELVSRVLGENPRIIADYRAGKRFASKAAVGRVMALTGGRAEPELLNEIIESMLKE